jgi:hypothetical protein
MGRGEVKNGNVFVLDAILTQLFHLQHHRVHGDLLELGLHVIAVSSPYHRRIIAVPSPCYLRWLGSGRSSINSKISGMFVSF